MDFSWLYIVAFILVVVGILIVVVSILVSTSKTREKESAEGGSKMRGAGVIMIGPIPIIFGTDKKSVKAVLALAIALTVVLLVYYYLVLR
jgi:uncharacterized protein (TIGR00304 family)